MLHIESIDSTGIIIINDQILTEFLILTKLIKRYFYYRYQKKPNLTNNSMNQSKDLLT